MSDQLNRYKGALMGLAVGDAVGTSLEFTTPGQFQPITDMIGGGPFRLLPGEWTDDTSMALCLAESLVVCQHFNPVDQLERYVKWWRQGHLSSTGTCFDIGNTVMSSLFRFEETGDAYCGSTAPDQAGNGSIMRLAPIPMFFSEEPEQAVHYAGLSSKTTHGADEAVDACRLLGALLVGALRGDSKEELLSSGYGPAAKYWEREPLAPGIAAIANGSYKQNSPPLIRGTGYVVQSLEAALWAFYHSKSYRQGLLMAVNLGEDADTTGAVYGQLAGAYYGYDQIPESWRSKVVHQQLILHLAEQLYELRPRKV